MLPSRGIIIFRFLLTPTLIIINFKLRATSVERVLKGRRERVRERRGENLRKFKTKLIGNFFGEKIVPIDLPESLCKVRSNQCARVCIALRGIFRFCGRTDISFDKLRSPSSRFRCGWCKPFGEYRLLADR